MGKSRKVGIRSAAIIVIIIIVLMILALFILSSGSQQKGILSKEKIWSVSLSYQNGSGQTVNVYVASTSQEQEIGLMNQSSMGDCNGLGDCYGMLFAFSSVSGECFWMKNTIMPLKQFWIINGVITAEYNATPYSTNTVCHNGNEVLETNTNSTLQVGDSIYIKEN